MVDLIRIRILKRSAAEPCMDRAWTECGRRRRRDRIL